MNRAYLTRLQRIVDAYEAARIALTYVIIHYDDQAIQSHIAATTKHKLNKAQETLDETYVVRLFAEFAGILKDHLQSNHSSLRVPPNARIGYLLNRLLRRDSINLDPVLQTRFELLRETRNSIAHQSSQLVQPMDFIEARKCLGKIVDLLPEPYQL